MARWRNSAERYGLIAMGLHWLIATAILAMLALGALMTDVSPASPLKFTLYQWHKSVGITILALSLVRLGWRLINPVPALPPHMPRWERLAARSTHVGFYALMLALPLSGWAMVSVSPWNIPTVLYGVVTLPHLPLAGIVTDAKAAESAFKALHEGLGWSLVALLALHIGGALKHHFVVKDEVLVRMLPWRTAREVGR
jgi:cytochrome b561